MELLPKKNKVLRKIFGPRNDEGNYVTRNLVTFTGHLEL